MRSIVRSFLVLAALYAGMNRCEAQVCLFYNPATGGVNLYNYGNARLFAVVLESDSPGLGELPLGDALQGAPLVIPGATLDTGDQPNAITYLNFPVGNFFIGNVVRPGTPSSSLSAEYYTRTFPNVPNFQGPFFGGTANICLPEPATSSLSALALVALAAKKRAAGGRRVNQARDTRNWMSTFLGCRVLPTRTATRHHPSTDPLRASAPALK